eukprot:TRINITY_DN9386_c0_g1_i1.p1 TRINITY_DN9386_c0_g1~~TRINITY_DN9386_c0_g1_i1.p1  ORF type:complete len:177 (-),score=29.13 TRINITY_DN9386_c0_g1_i1:202-732(-)
MIYSFASINTKQNPSPKETPAPQNQIPDKSAEIKAPVLTQSTQKVEELTLPMPEDLFVEKKAQNQTGFLMDTADNVPNMTTNSSSLTEIGALRTNLQTILQKHSNIRILLIIILFIIVFLALIFGIQTFINVITGARQNARLVNKSGDLSSKNLRDYSFRYPHQIKNIAAIADKAV